MRNLMCRLIESTGKRQNRCSASGAPAWCVAERLIEQHMPDQVVNQAHADNRFFLVCRSLIISRACRKLYGSSDEAHADSRIFSLTYRAYFG